MTHPIRVLHVVVNMNRGGAETLIMNLYRNIDRSKVQFDFLTCKEGIFDAEIIKMGGKVHRIPYLTEVGHFRYIKALNSFFASHRDYKIVHSHMDKMSGFVLHAAKRAGIPVRIAHSHSTESEGGVAARIYKWCASQLIPVSATNLLACSQRASEWLFGKDSSRCLIVKNGIDLNKFAFSHRIRKSMRELLGVGNNALVIGHVGRFCHPKNHTFLIDIFKDFVTLNPDSVLILVGDGPLRPDIERKVYDFKLTDKVMFLGVRNDINCLLQAFDVFVFPSLYEGLPVTLIEAQGAGVPCLISDAITHEADMGIDLTSYLPLHYKTLWVEKLNSVGTRSSDSKKSKFLLQKNGYDILEVSDWMKNYYLSFSR